MSGAFAPCSSVRSAKAEALHHGDAIAARQTAADRQRFRNFIDRPPSQ
jgi:hypothetical protein